MSGDLPKVLFCAFEVVPAPTGFSSRATEIIRALNQDFEVDALTAKSPDQSHIERYHGARLMRVPVGGGDLPQRGQAFQRAVRRQLESDEYQIVQFTDPYGGYALCDARAQYGFKLVYDASSFPSADIRYTHPHLEGDPRFLAKLRRQELYCLMNADSILVSSSVASDFVASLGVERSRINVVRTSVDLSNFPRDPGDRPDHSPMRLLYLGSQVTWQGLPLLLKAVAIAAENVDVRLSIVGQRHTSWRLQLDELVRELNLGGKVEFGNAVSPEQLAPILKTCDIGVAPLAGIERNMVQGASLNKISHYLAAGRAVIASDLPVCHEFLDDHCAVFPAPDDADDWAAQIVAFAEDAARRVAMGEAARTRAEQQQRSQETRRTLTRVYSTLVEMPTPGERSVRDGTGASERPGSEPTNLVAIDDPPTDLSRSDVPKASLDSRTDEHVMGEDPPTQLGRAPPSEGKLPIVAGKPISDLLEADLSPILETPTGTVPPPSEPPGSGRTPVVSAPKPASDATPPGLQTPSATAIPAAAASAPARTTSMPATPIIASGAPPPIKDEWIANLLFGYAPPVNGRPAAALEPGGGRARVRRTGVTEDSSPGVKV